MVQFDLYTNVAPYGTVGHGTCSTVQFDLYTNAAPYGTFGHCTCSTVQFDLYTNVAPTGQSDPVPVVRSSLIFSQTQPPTGQSDTVPLLCSSLIFPQTQLPTGQSDTVPVVLSSLIFTQSQPPTRQSDTVPAASTTRAFYPQPRVVLLPVYCTIAVCSATFYGTVRQHRESQGLLQSWYLLQSTMVSLLNACFHSTYEIPRFIEHFVYVYTWYVYMYQALVFILCYGVCSKVNRYVYWWDLTRRVTITSLVTAIRDVCKYPLRKCHYRATF